MLTLDKHTHSASMSLQPALSCRPGRRNLRTTSLQRLNAAKMDLTSRFQPQQRLATGHFVDIEV